MFVDTVKFGTPDVEFLVVGESLWVRLAVYVVEFERKCVESSPGPSSYLRTTTVLSIGCPRFTISVLIAQVIFEVCCCI